jgi:Skp family chaperone for outer membrane proteins
MKFRILILVILVFLQFDQVALAEAPSLVYATIDYERLIKNSQAFIGIERAVDDKRQIFLQNAQKQEKSLTKKRKTLEEGCAKKEKSGCENALRVNTEEFHQLNNQYNLQRNQLNEAFSKATAKIEAELTKIIDDKIKEKGYNIVFHKPMLLYSNPANEITEEVLKTLNKKLPSVKIKINN